MLFVWLFYVVVLAIAQAFPNYNTSDLGYDVYTPDEYAFNVSCLGCFIP